MNTMHVPMKLLARLFEKTALIHGINLLHEESFVIAVSCALRDNYFVLYSNKAYKAS